MFKYTIDNKSIFIRNDNVKLKDLGETIFNASKGNAILNKYMSNEEMVMRPDKISISALGNDDYTEMILKYNNVCNPFSVDKDEVFLIPTLESVYSDANTTEKETTIVENQAYDTSIINVSDASGTTEDTETLIRNYHKYSNRQTASLLTTASGYVNVSIPTTIEYNEPNMTKEGSKSIRIVNGVVQLGTDTGLNIAGLTGDTSMTGVDVSALTGGTISSLSGLTEEDASTNATAIANAALASLGATTETTATVTSSSNANVLSTSNAKVVASASDESISCLRDGMPSGTFLSQAIKNTLK